SAMRLATIRMPCEVSLPSGPVSPRRRAFPVGAGAPAGRSAGAALVTVVVLIGAPASDRELLVIADQPAAVEGGEDDEDGQQQHAAGGGLGELARRLPEAQLVGTGHEDLGVRGGVAEQQEDDRELVEGPDDAEQ